MHKIERVVEFRIVNLIKPLQKSTQFVSSTPILFQWRKEWFTAKSKEVWWALVYFGFYVFIRSALRNIGDGEEPTYSEGPPLSFAGVGARTHEHQVSNSCPPTSQQRRFKNLRCHSVRFYTANCLLFSLLLNKHANLQFQRVPHHNSCSYGHFLFISKIYFFFGELKKKPNQNISV